MVNKSEERNKKTPSETGKHQEVGVIFRERVPERHIHSIQPPHGSPNRTAPVADQYIFSLQGFMAVRAI